MGWMRIDHALITGLVERWRSETNTFHFPSGEATITLEDVAYIYSLSIDGPAITDRTYTHCKIDEICQELLGVIPQKGEDYNGVFLKFKWLERVFHPSPEELREKNKQKGKRRIKDSRRRKWQKPKRSTTLGLFFFVAGQLFCNSSGARGPFYILELFRDFRPYAWAFCCLANLYRMLNTGVHWEGLKNGEILDPTDENNAFEKKFKSLSALLQLLQIWVYFIMKIGRGFRPNQHQNYDIQFPLMVIWAHWLTGLTHLTTVREVRKQLNDLMSDERMPPAFVKHIVMDASQTAKLKVPSGHSWRVQLSKMVTGTYLHDGWLEFVKDNSLKDFDLLLFRYDGNRRFTVWIFDKTTCERGGNYLQHSSRHCLLQ